MRHALPPFVALALGLAWLWAGAGASASEPPPSHLLRFPDVHGDSVVFSAGEDLWVAPLAGGAARRLTIHDGEERDPKFSPDGARIAFTGEYDGNVDVYVMDRDGGDLRRLTFHPGDDTVVGWHPTEAKVLFRSARSSAPSRYETFYLVGVDGGMPEPLGLFWCGSGSFSPDGTRIAYTKTTREHRTWKRYRGGLAQEVWIHDLATGEERNLSRFDGTDRLPMWVGDRVWFSSDRDGVLNLYVADPDSGAIEQITRHRDYDVRRPSAGGTRIVYEIAGEIWALDTETRESARVPITLGTDAAEARPAWRDVSGFVTHVEISPSGKRALVVARGDVYTVPREHGPTRPLTRTSGARERQAVWSPDGTAIAAISDRTGEMQIERIDPSGVEPPRTLTSFGPGFRHALSWSPDGTQLAFTDQTLTLYRYELDGGRLHEVARATHENVDVALYRKPISDYAWSPDGRYIAYAVMNDDLLYQVFVHDVRAERSYPLSDGRFHDFGPVFTPDGEHLLFVSNRRFDPTLDDMDWEMVYKDVAGVYAVTLRADGPPYLPVRSDDEGVEPEAEPSTEARRPVAVTVDVDGLADRLQALPVPRGNYRELSAGDGFVLWLDAEDGDFNRFDYRELPPRTLRKFDRLSREVRDVATGVRGYRLSADRSHVVVRKDDAVEIVALASPVLGDGGSEAGPASSSAAASAPGTFALDLSGLRAKIDPRLEWLQIFDEAWRMERDWYYEPNMHGVDWEAMRAKYRPLIERASCRQDVRFVVGEMIGELGTSHTYVGGGERRRAAEPVGVGLLGVSWQVDVATKRYRFGRVLREPDWARGIVAPLSGPGVDVRDGDYLLRVDGAEVTVARNVHEVFEAKADRLVTIVVNDRPTEDGARTYTVRTVGNDARLRYADWVERNRRYVDERTGGAVGYLHLPDTYFDAMVEFGKGFYGQTRKRGLIVDGRYNGGGLDPHIFLRRLAVEPLGHWTRRHSHDQTIPPTATRAHMVCLTNRSAGSGGDMLPWEFRAMGLGPVIGTRSWGGLVGVSMFLETVDGGMLTAPDYRIYDTEGRWLIENEGVTPDIVVELDPAETARGADAQLDRAIELLLERIEREPRPWPSHPPFPSQGRSGDAREP